MSPALAWISGEYVPAGLLIAACRRFADRVFARQREAHRQTTRRRYGIVGPRGFVWRGQVR